MNTTNLKKLWEKVEDFFYEWRYHHQKLIWYFRNLRWFRKNLWDYRPYDYAYSVDLFARALQGLREGIIKGPEEPVMRRRKAIAIDELITLLDTTVTEEELNLESERLREISETPGKDYSKFEEDYFNTKFNRITRLLKGQSSQEISELAQAQIKALPEEERTTAKENDIWYKAYDGTGIRSWWVS